MFSFAVAIPPRRPHRALLARGGGHVRDPPAGGALLAGFAFAAGTAVFHWIASDILPADRERARHLDLLRADPLGHRRHPPRPGTRRDPRTRPAIRSSNKQRKKQRAQSPRPRPRRTPVVPEHERPHHRSVARRDATAVGTGPATATVVATALMSDFDGGIVAGYGDVEVLHGVDLGLEPEVVALLGANGAGKSTLCSVAAGLVDAPARHRVPRRRGRHRPPSFRRTRRLLLVPEAGGIFPGLTVEENLTVLLREEAHCASAYDRFPILAERRKQVAGLLSGGEQQMLSLAPALADPPTVLIADEPTLGLAPLAAEEVIAHRRAPRPRLAVLLVEETPRSPRGRRHRLAFMELGPSSGPARADADMDDSPAPTSAARLRSPQSTHPTHQQRTPTVAAHRDERHSQHESRNPRILEER